MTRIIFICHGNICRSPTAEYIMKELTKMRGCSDRFRVESAATSDDAIGCTVYSPARKLLEARGINCSAKRARRLTRGDYAAHDLLIGMDGANIQNILSITGGDPDGKVCRLLDFTSAPGDIADPWYTGDFVTAFAEIWRGCEALLAALDI